MGWITLIGINRFDFIYILKKKGDESKLWRCGGTTFKPGILSGQKFIAVYLFDYSLLEKAICRGRGGGGWRWTKSSLSPSEFGFNSEKKRRKNCCFFFGSHSDRQPIRERIVGIEGEIKGRSRFQKKEKEKKRKGSSCSISSPEATFQLQLREWIREIGAPEWFQQQQQQQQKKERRSSQSGRQKDVPSDRP